MAETKRRARGEDSIHYDRSRERWTGTITVGWKPDGRRDRIIVRGKTKTNPDDRSRIQASAPAGDAYRCHRAWPAVREQRKDGRRPKLNR